MTVQHKYVAAVAFGNIDVMERQDGTVVLLGKVACKELNNLLAAGWVEMIVGFVEQCRLGLLHH